MGSQRPILYLALVFVLFLIWQAWVEDYQTPKPTEMSQPDRRSQDGLPEQATPPTQPDDLPSVTADAFASDIRQDRLSQTDYVSVKTDRLIVDISLQGADLRRVALPTYPISLDQPDEPVQILDDQKELYIAQTGFVAAQKADDSTNDRTPDHYAWFVSPKNNYELSSGQSVLRVPFVWISADGVKVTKTYVFQSGQFTIGVEYLIENGSDTIWQARQYQQFKHGPKQDEDSSAFIHTFTGFAYYDDGFKKLKFDKLENDMIATGLSGGWVAVMEHYFVSAWIPDQTQAHNYYTKAIQTGAFSEYILGITSTVQPVEPGGSVRWDSQFYVGPKIQEDLRDLATGLDMTVDYGFFSFFARPLFSLLGFFHSVTQNWGIAIILVTLLIKVVFYYPSKASYQSMAKMRALQPKMQELKERYADDKNQMNQALMKLYQKEKVNPLGGCLPILIQLPVFIALYWVLIESVELRQAPFILWIDDLSVRDPYYVLPLVMGASMVVQQYLNPAPLDPIQQKIMMILPIAFTVFFMFFPAGLVLYWVVNNTLSIAQQWTITRRIEKAMR